MIKLHECMSTQPIHPSLLLRKIIHVDMDAYYAAVEMRDDPTLKGKPLIIGGSPQSRGVVCTASYEARKYGVKSAMACSVAQRLCPQALFLRPDFEKYKAVSNQIREIFFRHTPLVEPLSLDEAYLDVTNNPEGLYAVKIARLIQQEIFEKLHLSASAGVGPNKMIAKIASDVRKPFGITVIQPHEVLDFVGALPMRKIHGIGPSTEKVFTNQGIIICRDIWPFEIETLKTKFGTNLGSWIFLRARGIDERNIETSRERKSLGQEETFGQDLLNLLDLEKILFEIAQGVAKDLKKRNIAGKTITLKIKYADFERATRQISLEKATSDAEELFVVARDLLLNKTKAGQKKIRLLGISISKFS